MNYFTQITESMFGLITSQLCKDKMSHNAKLILSLISGAVEPILIAFTTLPWMQYVGIPSLKFGYVYQTKKRKKYALSNKCVFYQALKVLRFS